MTDVIRIRPAHPEDAGAIARLQVDSYRNAYAGIFPQDYLDRFSYDDQERDWIELLGPGASDLILVAQADEAGIAGYAVAQPQASYPTPYDSELVSLHVRRTLHRQGIGRKLVSAAAGNLAARGCQALMLWVLEANPARAFYERLGAIPLDGRRPAVNVFEVAYGWPDMHGIVAPPAEGRG